ncbi:MAG: hypothetical protein EOO65_03120 [Methanosarcinales archaeon]|nr:MAG: hypothetical protein EOO65_03120 [Methanosarcinales archaeon]
MQISNWFRNERKRVWLPINRDAILTQRKARSSNERVPPSDSAVCTLPPVQLASDATVETVTSSAQADSKPGGSVVGDAPLPGSACAASPITPTASDAMAARPLQQPNGVATSSVTADADCTATLTHPVSSDHPPASACAS